ncbi:hypothetical protein SAMN05421678_108161 [Actinopolymorpha cephalotaxi]|uniref:Uncharacterized protein n=1 Tax=Actinopolymorpha cephalotaxi TaxID=504797 RepID=A0A1I2UI40_9ACTN|nr:hypothetical protein [Actinopolymorpha cephalotaxi]SFG76009.1 hypothetical protein SAMN05421678_108161 [Actinopolymorpha cephalotaxi]
MAGAPPVASDRDPTDPTTSWASPSVSESSLRCPVHDGRPSVSEAASVDTGSASCRPSTGSDANVWSPCPGTCSASTSSAGVRSDLDPSWIGADASLMSTWSGSETPSPLATCSGPRGRAELPTNRSRPAPGAMATEADRPSSESLPTRWSPVAPADRSSAPSAVGAASVPSSWDVNVSRGTPRSASSRVSEPVNSAPASRPLVATSPTEGGGLCAAVAVSGVSVSAGTPDPAGARSVSDTCPPRSSEVSALSA